MDTGTHTAADALADRLLTDTLGALELFSVFLGRELGLYEALAAGPCTPDGLARTAGIAPRYAREWLEQQAAAGLLETITSKDLRRYALPAAYRPVLLEPESPAHVAPLADLIAGIAGVLPRLPDAYRSGAGVPYRDYGPIFRRGQGGINRPMIAHELPGWLAAVPGLGARLTAPASPRIADVACGEGWSTVALARAFPGALLDAYDIDPDSVGVARSNAAAAGVASRVECHLADAAEKGALGGPYDLILIVEALHDLARPVPLLEAARDALGPGGVIVVVDERVADRFRAPAGEVERLMYGWSVTHCLPAALAEQPSAGLGTVLRAPAVVALAEAAGLGAEVLPLGNDFFRVYALSASAG
ncbi:class I SAM-dependent methyltransferase [Symbioplanes lichenis]|uniref:class I SAM-dependent methyltransferase n=1 Tax=Symbioplanes lichenis TaxID=1629072 RepID=UPI002738B112|nr:methyltransferase domain-containing protein [Actinoplanes lichenis]